MAHVLGLGTCIVEALVTQKFAEEIGADGCAVDAGAATKLAKTLMQR